MKLNLAAQRLLLASSILMARCAATGKWLQIGSDIDGENPRDFAGGTRGALAMSRDGTTVAVGAAGHDAGGDSAGHVRVFDIVNGQWKPRGSDIQGEAARDRSGSAVVLSADGNVVAIGEPGSEAGNAGRFERDYGRVRVFEWRDGSWVQRGPAIAGVERCDFSSAHGGLAMDASGSALVVGAAEHGESGHARVFDWDGGRGLWVQRGGDLEGEAPGDWFGAAVAISAEGRTVAVGAPFNDVKAEAGPFGCEVCRGSVRLFDWDEDAGEWLQRGRDLDGERDGDKSGSTVAINGAGDVVAIGSPRSSASFDPEPGSVAVYAWDGSAWRQRGARIEGEEIGGLSGSALVMSASGDAVAIGARLNDGGSDTEGHVRVFDWDGGAWLQRGDDIDGENRFDYSGYSLAMSADGDRLASGARFTADAGYFAGHVRVFEWDAADEPPATTTTEPPATTTAEPPATTTTEPPATTTMEPPATTTTEPPATTTTEPPATTTTEPPATTMTTTTEPNKCGDSRFEESENGMRYGGKIASFPRSRVGTIGACSVKCADTSNCLGIRWNPGKRRPCTTLKGRLNRRCGSSNVCCTQVGDFTLDSSD